MEIGEVERQPSAQRLAAWEQELSWFFQRATPANRGGPADTGGGALAQAGSPQGPAEAVARSGPVMGDVPPLG